jgi:hypothetical protein
MFVGIYYFRPLLDVLGLMAYLVVVTVALIATVVLKGERPLRWRWGRR